METHNMCPSQQDNTLSANVVNDAENSITATPENRLANKRIDKQLLVHVFGGSSETPAIIDPVPEPLEDEEDDELPQVRSGDGIHPK